MLEDMALMFLPDAVNVGLCGKATLGSKGVEWMVLSIAYSFNIVLKYSAFSRVEAAEYLGTFYLFKRERI